jgi:zinc/manganese transport system substrate-binding protein
VWRLRPVVALLALGSLLVVALGLPPRSPAAATEATSSGTVIHVVAAENFWGSIASQIGGKHVRVTSIITNPNTDPHSYEPTASDARTLAAAQFVIENGIGYDPWVPRLLAADQGNPRVLNVGDLVGVADGGNPHRWYNPTDVQTVIARMTTDLTAVDPRDRAYFKAQAMRFDTVALKPYDDLIAAIRAKYAGTPVGASESIFAMLAPALGLNLITPPAFLKAISEGTDVSAADKETIDNQIKTRQIKIYVYNSQNVTPDVQAQLSEVKAQHIPYTTITETLDPARLTYQAWQTRQLKGIQTALARGVGAGH